MTQHHPEHDDARDGQEAPTQGTPAQGAEQDTCPGQGAADSTDAPAQGTSGDGDLPDSPFTPEEAAAHEASLDAEKARQEAAADPDQHPDTLLAAERLADLQRLQAEYVNYKKRVDRDKGAHRELGISSVIEAMMPVLDEIALARQHGDLTEGTPFARIADKLQQALARFGLEQFGQAGDAFDPNVHEALMHVEAELPQGADGTTVVQVLQPGYRQGERVLRAARVSVADPE